MLPVSVYFVRFTGRNMASATPVTVYLLDFLVRWLVTIYFVRFTGPRMASATSYSLSNILLDLLADIRPVLPVIVYFVRFTGR